MTIAQSILAVANKVQAILSDINTAITGKGGQSVNCLDDVAPAINGLAGVPANSVVITDTFGDRTIYFNAYESGGEKYDSNGIKADIVKAVNYGDVTQVYAVFGNSASALRDITFSCFKAMGAAAEIYFTMADGVVNIEVGSAAFPQIYSNFDPIFTIMYNNTDIETITVYLDTTDADYETFIDDLTAIAESMTDCTLTIYDVTDGTAVLHGGE